MSCYKADSDNDFAPENFLAAVAKILVISPLESTTATLGRVEKGKKKNKSADEPNKLVLKCFSNHSHKFTGDEP